MNKSRNIYKLIVRIYNNIDVFHKNSGLATKWLRVLSIPPNNKVRNHLVASPITNMANAVALLVSLRNRLRRAISRLSFFKDLPTQTVKMAMLRRIGTSNIHRFDSIAARGSFLRKGRRQKIRLCWMKRTFERTDCTIAGIHRAIHYVSLTTWEPS